MADAQATSTTPASATPENTAAAETTTENLFGEDVAQVADEAASDTTKSDVNAAKADDAENLFDGRVKDDAEKSEGEDGKSGDDAEGVPEKYEFKAPEGMELDKELADEFTPIAKELGLNNEKAQKLVDHFSAKVLTKLAARQATQLKTLQGNWAKEAKADPEFGGSKSNLDANMASVARAKAYGGEAFSKEINALGVGNNPTLLKFLAKVGKALAEDAPAVGGVAAGSPEPKAILYPNQMKG